MLPNLIIIGAQKCGTTSLYYYLSLHPEIAMSRQKELDFFIEEYNWHKGIEWYQSNFSGSAKIYGEASPRYTYFPILCGVPKKMYTIVPDAKLIYVVRDPVDRIISDYVQYCAAGEENRTISEALSDLSNNRYVQLSCYHLQLQQYLKYFPEAQILVVSAEDLHKRRFQTMQKIFAFLNVQQDFYTREFSIKWHVSKYKRRRSFCGEKLGNTAAVKYVIDLLPFSFRGPFEKLILFPFSEKVERPNLQESLKNRLIDILRDDIYRLRELTGGAFSDWCL